MVSVSGVRGVVGKSLTPEVITRYTLAYGTFLNRGTVVVGRDTRTSGPMVKNLVIGSLLSTGCDVVDIGITTTPTLGLAIADWRATGGLMITGSHNPAEWNALKFFGADEAYLSPQKARQLYKLADNERFTIVDWQRTGTVTADNSQIEKHISKILVLPLIDAEQIRERKFRVAIDCTNGSGSLVLPHLLVALGCEVVALYCEPNGLFPHNPEPTPAHLHDLEQKVKEVDADIGLAVDPDVDRLSLVTGQGRALEEEYTLALVTEFVLRKSPGAVVVNLSTTRRIDDLAQKYNCPIYHTPVGEANVVAGLRKYAGVIGGEGNGGVILPALHFGRDALVGTALLLQYLLEENRPLHELAADLPVYTTKKIKLPFSAPGRAPAPGERSRTTNHFQRKLKKLALAFDTARADWRDGLRLDWPNGWLQVRKSNTEPVYRIIVETTSEKVATRWLSIARKVLAA